MLCSPGWIELLQVLPFKQKLRNHENDGIIGRHKRLLGMMNNWTCRVTIVTHGTPLSYVHIGLILHVPTQLKPQLTMWVILLHCKLTRNRVHIILDVKLPWKSVRMANTTLCRAVRIWTDPLYIISYPTELGSSMVMFTQYFPHFYSCSSYPVEF